MAIPVYLFLTDDAGNIVKGGVDIRGREKSIEVLGLHHGVFLPTDDLTGEISGMRNHLSYLIEKEIDCSSPWLYKALTSGRTFRTAELKFFQINTAGQEKEYFNTLLEDVKVVTILPVMHDIKDETKKQFNHMEAIEFRYRKITWKYLMGNIIHSDNWDERKSA